MGIPVSLDFGPVFIRVGVSPFGGRGIHSIPVGYPPFPSASFSFLRGLWHSLFLFPHDEVHQSRNSWALHHKAESLSRASILGNPLTVGLAQ